MMVEFKKKKGLSDECFVKMTLLGIILGENKSTFSSQCTQTAVIQIGKHEALTGLKQTSNQSNSSQN